MQLLGRVLGSRYRLGELIATGGMGEVYRGVDERTGRTVAIKVLRPEFAGDPTYVTRFEQEAHVASRLRNPHVVAVHDMGQDGPTHYLVMDYIEGDTLRDRLHREGRPGLPMFFALADEIASGVSAIHAAGLIHRDIKPANVLLDRQGRAHVTDFGIVRIPGDASLTATGTVLGTANYLSPEQAKLERTTPASDVYSLGVLLYELATGSLPFKGDTPLAVALQHIQDAPPPPSALAPGLPPALEDVLLRTLAKNPDARYPDAAALRHALRQARNSVPALADTTSWVAAGGTEVMPGGMWAGARPRAAARHRLPWWLLPMAALLVVCVLLGVLLVNDVTPNGLGALLATSTPTRTATGTPTSTATNTATSTPLPPTSTPLLLPGPGGPGGPGAPPGHHGPKNGGGGGG